MIGNRTVTTSSFQSLALESETAKSAFQGTTVFLKCFLLKYCCCFFIKIPLLSQRIVHPFFPQFWSHLWNAGWWGKARFKTSGFFLNFVQMETSVRLVLNRVSELTTETKSIRPLRVQLKELQREEKTLSVLQYHVVFIERKFSLMLLQLEALIGIGCWTRWAHKNTSQNTPQLVCLWGFWCSFYDRNWKICVIWNGWDKKQIKAKSGRKKL